MIATAPGKLMLTGEYAVLDGAPALMIAVDRRVVARIPTPAPRGSSPFLLAVVDELAERGLHDAAARAMTVAVDSSSFYAGAMKLGFGSSAAVTVAATARALASESSTATDLDRDLVHTIAAAAHARAQGAKGARGSGADVATSTFGGAIEFAMGAPIGRKRWPDSVVVVPYFTGASADTAVLVQRVAAARESQRVAVDAALRAVADASRAACDAISMRDASLVAGATIGALQLAAAATDRLATATGAPLVPDAVIQIRKRLHSLGGTTKTTGAGGGDVAIAVIPAARDRAEDRIAVQRYIIEQGCTPLTVAVDPSGVDLRPVAQ